MSDQNALVKPVETVTAEPVWEVVEASSTTPTGRQVIKIPIPTGDDLTLAQEAYLLKQQPGYQNTPLSTLMLVVRKAQAMGLSALRGDVSLIDGRVATSDSAKGRAVVTNRNLKNLSISEPTEQENPILCSCGHPKILHKGGKANCLFKAETKSGTKVCSCVAVQSIPDVFVSVSAQLGQGTQPVTVKTWLSEWYNAKNDAWVNYPYDRLIAKAISRFGERFSPIGEDGDAFIAPVEPAPPDPVEFSLREAVNTLDKVGIEIPKSNASETFEVSNASK